MYIPDVILIIRPKQVSECTRTVVACTFMSAVLKTPSQYISDVQLRQDKSHPEEEKPECLAAEAGIVKFHRWLLTCFHHEICIYYGIYIYIKIWGQVDTWWLMISSDWTQEKLNQAGPIGQFGAIPESWIPSSMSSMHGLQMKNINVITDFAWTAWRFRMTFSIHGMAYRSTWQHDLIAAYPIDPWGQQSKILGILV